MMGLRQFEAEDPFDIMSIELNRLKSRIVVPVFKNCSDEVGNEARESAAATIAQYSEEALARARPAYHNHEMDKAWANTVKDAEKEYERVLGEALDYLHEAEEVRESGSTSPRDLRLAEINDQAHEDAQQDLHKLRDSITEAKQHKAESESECLRTKAHAIRAANTVMEATAKFEYLGGTVDKSGGIPEWLLRNCASMPSTDQAEINRAREILEDIFKGKPSNW